MSLVKTIGRFLPVALSLAVLVACGDKKSEKPAPVKQAEPAKVETPAPVEESVPAEETPVSVEETPAEEAVIPAEEPANE